MGDHPSKIGKYEVVGVIGRGGMGIVYKASDPQIGRFVAIKMITAGFAGNPELLKRFYREAQSTGNLQNPNIVTVYDLGDQEGNPYLVMEYLEGVSLESIISSRQPLGMAQKLGILIDVCHGLSYAHQRGVIHRDIKPANIMVLNDGAAKIVDFGIARIGDSRLTRTDQVIGSIHYMSPEQLHNEQLDFRTDIFSAGVVLFQLLTYALPFEANETAATLLKIIKDPPPPLSSYLQDFPPELETVIQRSLAKDREERYGSAHDLAFDLLRIQEELKREAVAEHLHRAEMALQHADWSKAREQLQQVLTLDRQHTAAQRLLREVQEQLLKKKKSDQARQLRSQADAASAEQDYDEALRLIDQAINLDETNPELLSFRNSVQNARVRAAKLQRALSRAEAAQNDGDLEAAKRAITEALAIDPNDTQARALEVVISRQLEEHARQQQMKNLLSDAYGLINDRRLTEAFSILKQAEAIDPHSVELLSLVKLAVSAREQQVRKAELEQLCREIQEALSREDYTTAVAKAQAGLEKYPRDNGLVKLKTLAEAQRQRVEQRVFVREKLALASDLYESGQTVEALAVLEQALQKVPTDPQLESLRSRVKERLTREESEQHKNMCLQRAREACTAGRFDDAISTLERTLREFPDSVEVAETLQEIRALHIKDLAVGEALTFANQLLQNGELDRAVRFLDSTCGEMQDARLGELLNQAQSQLELFQENLRTAVSKAQQILQGRGPEEARKFLDSQPKSFSSDPEFRGLEEAIRKRVALTSLDRLLAKSPDLDVRAQVLEEALRRDPGSAEIQGRLLSVNNQRRQVFLRLEQSRGLERTGQFVGAAKELALLREVYPEYPGLESEITRLERLAQQCEVSTNETGLEEARRESWTTLPQGDAHATSILGQASPAGATFRSIESNAAVLPAPTTDSSPKAVRSRQLWITTAILGAVACVVLALGIYWWFFLSSGSRQAKDKIQTGLSSEQPSETSSPSQAAGSEPKPGPPTETSVGAVTSVPRSDDKLHKKIPTTSSSDTTSIVRNLPQMAGKRSTEPPPATVARPAPAVKDTTSYPSQPAPQPDNVQVGKQAPSNSGEVSSNQPAKTEQAPGGVQSVSRQTQSINAPPVKTDVPITSSGVGSQPVQAGGTTVAKTEIPVSSVIRGPSLLSQEQDKIQRLLDSYGQAFQSKDRIALRHVWPTMSDKQFKDMQGAFKDADSIRLTLRKSGVPDINGSKASVSCVQDTEIKVQGQIQQLSYNATFYLKKLGESSDADWIIDRVKYRKTGR